MRIIISYICFFLLPVSLMAQHNAPIADLLKEAQEKLYFQPGQTGKIAEYIVGQEQNNPIKTEATLLLAKSFYVRGNYNEAVKNALKAKKGALASTDDGIKRKTTFFAILLLQELGLYSVAEKYKKELDGSGKVFVSSKIFQQTSPMDSAKISPEGKTASPANDFQKMQQLYNLGNRYFLDKNYKKAIETLQQVLALSLKLPNKNYENKSAESLAVNYLALEDTKNFLFYKQKANTNSIEVETDKHLAVNSVYNFINTSQKERSESKIHRATSWLYILGCLFVLLLITGYSINYLYTSKAKEYSAIYKYLAPIKTYETPIAETENPKKDPIVPEETEQILLQKLEAFEAGKKFTNPDMSIALLAAQFDTNTKYLSEVINRQKGKNFNSYINELRINYIIEKLKSDSVYFNYKISYLAKECGFSSHSSFATVFKSVTGISPTKFMDFLQKRKETA